MVKIKNLIKFIILIFVIIIGGRAGYKIFLSFGLVKILLFALAAVVFLEVIYKIDKYFSKKY